MRRKILAVDFDDTLFWTDYYSYECEPNWPVINYVRKRQKEGWIIICGLVGIERKLWQKQ